MRYISLFVFELLLIQICSAQALPKTDWIADIDFLAQELPQKHRNLFTVKDKNWFLTGLDKIKSNSHDLTDFETAVQLQQLVALLGDSHTKITYGQRIDRNKVLPLYLYWYSDGLYILHTTSENSDILGCQILSVNGVELKTITDSLRTLITVDNEALVKRNVPEVFPLVQLFEYFGFTNGQEIKLTLKDLNGNIKTHVLNAAPLTRENRKMFKPDSLALCYHDVKSNFIDYYRPTDKLYYLQYNKCSSKELELQFGDAKKAEQLPSFHAFEERVFQTLKNEPVEKIVFDMRFNEGGNSTQGTEFIEKLSAYLKTNPKVKLYVVVGRDTFSSAILNALDFKRLTPAIFVGEETAGKPNHFGEVKSFQLPSSGITVRYSTKYFERTEQKNVNTITPDVKLETSFQDYSHGVDPVYEWIIRH